MVPHDYLLNLSLLILGLPPIVQVLVSRMAIAHIGTHISSLNVVPPNPFFTLMIKGFF